MKEKKTLKDIVRKKGKMKKRTIVLLIILGVIIVFVAIGGIYFLKKSKGGQKQQFPFGNMQGGNRFAMTGDMVMASGVTSVGVTEEKFEVEELTTSLEIEEVYINSNDEITEGSKVLKLSEGSIEEAREELKQTLKEAELAYRAGTIEYEQSKITAEYDKENTLLNGQQAKAVYDENVAGLTDSVERAREELEQAKADIKEYQSYVNDGSYRSYFKVDEYQAIYDKTLEELKNKMEEWGVSWSQVTGQGGGGTMGNNMGSTVDDTMGNIMDNTMGNGMPGADMPVLSTVSEGDSVQSSGPSSDQIKVLASLYDVLEVQRKDLDQAESDYQNAVANAAFELQTLELQLPELENALIEAEKNYKNQILQAEVTYQTSLNNAKNAESDYETALEQAETTYESLKKDWEDAKKNLEIFENSVGDGYFYASGNGTILRTMVRAGQYLSAEGTIFMYSNPEEMTVTVSVDQKNIAEITLDDTVYIQSGEFGGFEGIVTEVNPVSDSESRTSVTYTVTVRFSGEVGKVGANESVTVIFGMDEETMKNMMSPVENSETQGDRMPEGFNPENMPEGFDPSSMPEGFTPGQMPEGSDPSSMPEGFNPENMPEGFDASSMPEGFTPGQRPQGGRKTDNNGSNTDGE